MSARFNFEVDRRNDLVKIRMWGFFGPADIDAFLVARRKAHAQLSCGPNEHLTLNDISGMKIQSLESVAAFHDILAAPEYRSRRLAFVVATTLAQSQLKRALANRKARCFGDPVTAETWLIGEAEDAEPLWQAVG